MRIAQLLSVGISNGAARHCLALCEHLARHGHEVLLLHRRWLEVSEAEAAGVTCLEFEFKRSPRALTDTLRLLRDRRIDVVHTHMSAAHAYGVLLRFMGGLPTVATAHARHFQPHWAFNDLVIAPSETTARYQRRVNLVPRSKLRVIPSFLGAQWFNPPTAEQRLAARALLDVASDALVIGQVGDVHFDKRQSDLVLAARNLIAERPRVVVALMGGRPDRIEVARLARASRGLEPNLRFVARQGDVGRFLHALDIFAISSRREEGPMVAVEAMSAGLPIVSTRVGRMQELIGSGEAGLLVEPSDVTALGAALRRLADDSDLRAAMGQASRRRALAHENIAAAVDRIEAVLAAAASGRLVDPQGLR